MQKNKPALKKMKNEIVIIEVWIVVYYSLLNVSEIFILCIPINNFTPTLLQDSQGIFLLFEEKQLPLRHPHFGGHNLK